MPGISQTRVPSVEKDFHIIQRDGKWCLIAKSTGKTLGCHDSKEGAENQERAVQANKSREVRISSEDMLKLCEPCSKKMSDSGVKELKLDLSKTDFGVPGMSDQAIPAVREYAYDMIETHNLKGVEIFSVGEWNGDSYTKQDLETLASSFMETKPYLKPYLKLGHGDDQNLIRQDELPNVGKISSVYVQDDKLVADFERMPKVIFELIRAGLYDRLSCEIYENAKVNGKIYPLTLKAIGILGGETPAVENLADIQALFTLEESVLQYEKDTKLRVHRFHRSPREEAKMPKECGELLEEARKEIDEYKKRQMSLEGEAKKFSDESAALKTRVAELEKENGDIKKQYSEAQAEIGKVQHEKLVSQVESDVKELVSSKKILPAQSEALKALMLHSLESGVKKFKLGDKELDGKEALLEFISKGSGSGLPTNEKTEQGKSGALPDKYTAEFVKEVEKYAAEKKLSFKDAYIQLTAKQAEESAR